MTRRLSIVLLSSALAAGCHLALDLDQVHDPGADAGTSPSLDGALPPGADAAALPDAGTIAKADASIPDGGCVPEDEASFCARMPASCGMTSGEDNCQVQRSAACGKFLSVWAGTVSAVYSAGDHGRLCAGASQPDLLVPSGAAEASATFLSVSASGPGDVWAVGRRGVAGYFIGRSQGTWRSTDWSGPLHAISASPLTGSAWAGADGTLVRCTEPGLQCTAMERRNLPSGDPITSVSAIDLGRAFAADGKQFFLYLAGSDAQIFGDPADGWSSVWTNGNVVWAASTSGKIAFSPSAAVVALRVRSADAAPKAFTTVVGLLDGSTAYAAAGTSLVKCQSVAGAAPTCTALASPAFDVLQLAPVLDGGALKGFAAGAALLATLDL